MASIVWGSGVNGGWTDPTKWNPNTVPGAGDDVTISAAGSYTLSIAEADAADSLTIDNASASLLLTGAGSALTVTNGFTNAGALDVNTNAGDGGSLVTVGGTLNNSGGVAVGNGALSSGDTLTVAALVNSGSITVNGNYTTAIQASLIVQSAAPAVFTGSMTLLGDAELQYASGAIVSIDGYLGENGDASVGLADSAVQNAALAQLGIINGEFDIVADSLTTTTNLSNAGKFAIDDGFFSDYGASTVTIGGTLTNPGSIDLGTGDNALQHNDTLTVAALVNTGSITVYGNYNNVEQASLIVQSAAPGTLDGATNLFGDALLQYASGDITTIAGYLGENGQGRVALAAAPGSNSALATLGTISGTFDIVANALTTTTNLVNSGKFDIDDAFFSDYGASTVTIGGTLTNTGSIYLGTGDGALENNDTLTVAALINTGVITVYGNYNDVELASLIVQSAAPTTLGGATNLFGDALLQYASGDITTIAGYLGENGQGRIGLAAAPGTNSALSTLGTISGTFDIVANSLTTTTNLVNSGKFDIDDAFFSDYGASTIAIGGTLTNTGSIYLGTGDDALENSDTLTVAALINTGSISVYGNYNNVEQASLIVQSAAPGTLSGVTNLFGDALLQYASGGITTLAGYLGENGDGRIALAAAPGSNSALATLGTISGTFDIVANSLTTTTNLVNSGKFDIDDAFFSDYGASTVTIGGTLTNTGSIYLGTGDNALQHNDTLTVAALINTGSINVYGNYNNVEQASLIVQSAAPATLSGVTTLFGDALLQYASGGITAISGYLAENGQGRIGLAAAPGSNSALATLAVISGTFDIVANALSTTRNLLNSGKFDIDDAYFSDYGASTITIGGALSNTGSIYLGTGDEALQHADTLSANGLVNSGIIYITGNGSSAIAAMVAIRGSAGNTGTVILSGDATLSVTGTFAESIGVAQIGDGATLKATSVSLSGGVIDGTGTIVGVVDETGGTLLGGAGSNSAGTLAIDGGFAISGSGVFEADLGGAGAGQYSVTDVTGAVTLTGGTLDVSTFNGFNLTLGDSFTILNFSQNQLTGTFAAIDFDGTVASNGSLVDIGNGELLRVIYNIAQGSVTLAVTSGLGNVPPAAGNVAPETIAVGNVHAGATVSIPVTIDNTATAPAAFLDAGIFSVSGQATASGTVGLLGAGASNTTSLRAGLSTLTDGAKTGAVTVDLASDAANGNSPSPLANQTIAVSGTVYNYATATVTAPSNIIVHAGASGTITLGIANSARADGFSENLVASLSGATGLTITSGGTTGELAAGASDSDAFSFTYTAPATAGVVQTTATLSLISDGGTDGSSIDGLGTTALPSIVVPIGITVDNPAQAGFIETSGPGTITGSGTNFFLNLGAIAQGSGPFVLGLGAANVATGQVDQLAGSFSSAGAFTTSGLGVFGGVGAGSADVAPKLTLDTANPGVYTETLTLDPSGENTGGYFAALPAGTLTVTGTVEPLPSPTISAPGTVDAFAGIATQLGTITIADPNNAEPVTVTISDASGILTAMGAGGGTVVGSGSKTLTLTGSLADIDAMLASASVLEANAGSDDITITATDSRNAKQTISIPLSVGAALVTGATINAPTTEKIISGVTSGINGLSVSDPSAEATGQPITFSFTAPAGTTVTVSGPAGATVLGQGTNAVTITGTPSQINADLADGISVGQGLGILAGLIAILGAIAGINNNNGNTNPPSDFRSTSVTQTEVNTYDSAVQEIDSVTTYDYRTGGPTGAGGNNVHIATSDGLLYEFNAEGEFTLARSTLTGSSFDVQVRLEPLANSTAASAITQAAMSVGLDRVTVGAGRLDAVWINGTPVALTVNTPLALSGGQITELGDNVYQILWNTGETATIAAFATYLNVDVSLSSGDPAGSVVGLVGPDLGQASDFELPDGTILQQPLSQSQLYGTFANAWRVTDATSLFDYAPGQTTATFTNIAFPAGTLTLSDFPSTLVAQAQQAVAAAGITDPSAATATEMDYIASGEDPAVITEDQSFLGTATHETGGVTTSTTSVGVLLVSAAQPDVIPSTSQPTPVVFDISLTNSSTADTVVDYTVVSTSTEDLGAAVFGGVLPSGTVKIPAGQKTVPVTIDVPVGALGLAVSSTLEVAISATDGAPVFAGTAQTTLGTAQHDAPPVPTLLYLSAIGDFSEVNATTYNLDLGPIVLGQDVPSLHIGVNNKATAPADELGGVISAPTIEGFSVGGTGTLEPIMAGNSYQGLTISIVQDKFGPNSESIVYTPTDTDYTGYSQALPAVTLDVSYVLESPTTAYSEAWGDVHIITYNGLEYNFQAVGEFVLARSTAPGDDFDIQLRLQPTGPGSYVTKITQVAISLGAGNDVTFDDTRGTFVELNDNAATIGVGVPLVLSGGTVDELSSTSYEVKWNTGETAAITAGGGYINVTDSFPEAETGTIQGIQGENEGQANEFQLPDGTVLPQPLSTATLYGEFANAWRVSDATSLFQYGPDQDTSTFTDLNYPADVVSLSSLPSSVVNQAAQMVAAAGITNPAIAQAAELDYIATGDPSYISAAANVQQTGFTATAATVTPSTPAQVAIGVNAAATKATEASTGTTPVVFNLYLTTAATIDTPIAYTLYTPNSTYLGAAAFGGTAPSGQVTIAGGQTMTQVTIDVPQAALGSLPEENLGLQVTAPNGNSVFAPTAYTEIVNPTPEAGSPAIAALTEISGGGTLTNVGNAYTLDLGTVAKDTLPNDIQFAIENTATAGSDNLSGTFTTPLGTGFIVTGDNIGQVIAPGENYAGLYFSPTLSNTGTNGMTLTFTPDDVNDSGYSQSLTPITLTVKDSVTAPAAAQLNTPGTVIFSNVRVGTSETRPVSITNTASAPAANLDVTPSANGSAAASGSITNLAPGATDASSISIGLNTSAAGAVSGAVSLNASSAAGGAGTSAAADLPESPVVDVFGSVYRPATASTIAPVSEIVHVGDPGTILLPVTNTDTADGYSENLVASLAAVSGGFSPGAGTSTGDIAAGNSSALAVTVSTASAATLSGAATIDLASDGGAGTSALDGLGTLALAPQTAAISVTVDNYVTAELEKLSGAGVFTQSGAVATLNFGVVTLGAAAPAANLAVLNAATGPADSLSGTFATTASGGFTTSGLTAFSGLGAGQSDAAPAVTLNTSEAGVFTQTITVDPTGSNISGYSAALPAEVLTVTGTVDNPAAPVLEQISGPGTFSRNGAAATLNLGSVVQGDAPLVAGLAVLNVANAPADTLSGSFIAPASAGFSTGGLAAFTGLGAGQSDASPTVTLDTGSAGVFSQTITLEPTGSNAAGSESLPAEIVTVTGTVTPPPIIVAGLLPFAALGVAATDPAAAISVTATLTPPVPGIYSNLGGGTLNANGTVYTTDQTAAVDTAALEGATFGTTTTGAPLLGVSATINGAAGTDATLIDAGGGTDFLTMGEGNDTILALPNDASLFGGPGDDLFYAIGGHDTITGGTGASTIVGGSTATTILTGTANDVVFDGGGAASIAGVSGADTVLALSGADTINTGTGANLIGAAVGNNLVLSTGADTLIAGYGADTMNVTGDALAFGASGSLLFFNGAGTSTVIGDSGSGPVTVQGGAGGGLFAGGTGGDNLITAGQQTTTIYGGGAGDTLLGAGSAADVFVAGGGNETLSGAGTSGNDIYFAGPGAASIAAGSGSNVIVAGSGDATVGLGSGSNVVAIIAGQAGGADLLTNFVVGTDLIAPQGFAGDPAAFAMADATVAGNAVSFTLPDNTRVTIANLTSLNGVFAPA